MRIAAAVSIVGLLWCVGGWAQSPAEIWNQCKAKRLALPSVHQEFEHVRLTKMLETTRSIKEMLVVDLAQGNWRESESAFGSIRVFNGEDFFYREDDQEYVSIKWSNKEGPPSPDPYSWSDADWSNAKQVKQGDCGLSTVKHSCVWLQFPLKPNVRLSRQSESKVVAGVASVLLDLDSGVLLSARSLTKRENSNTSQGSSFTYQVDESYQMKSMKLGSQPDAALFAIPENAKKVSSLKPWDAARIKKSLKGKSAPDFAVTDLHGEHLSLADYKGKTVLLDFFTTWCGPCREDAPSIDRLYQKYGGKNLAIVGVSMGEERSVVEKFLADHPHPYPIVLSSENEMPRAYQVEAYPTYMVIDTEGNVLSAEEGTQGFSELRHLLKKAGLDID